MITGIVTGGGMVACVDQSRPQDHNPDLLLVEIYQLPFQTDELRIALLKERHQAVQQELED
jgi:hypothetical protein